MRCRGAVRWLTSYSPQMLFNYEWVGGLIAPVDKTNLHYVLAGIPGIVTYKTIADVGFLWL